MIPPVVGEVRADFRPDYGRGYLRIPLGLWRTLYCRGLLTRRQLQVVSAVIRDSWGWQAADGSANPWTRRLTPAQLSTLTGLALPHVRATLRELLARRILREQAGRYQFVGDPQLWISLGMTRPNWPENRPNRAAMETESVPLTPSLKKLKILNKDSEWGDVDNSPNDQTALPFVPAAHASSFQGPSAQGPLVGLAPPPVVAPSALHLAMPSAPRSSSSSGIPSEMPSEMAFVGPDSDRPLTHRLADVIAAFVGTLSPEEAEDLRQWICDAGVASVWQALEPALRTSPLAARQALVRCLAARRNPDRA